MKTRYSLLRREKEGALSVILSDCIEKYTWAGTMKIVQSWYSKYDYDCYQKTIECLQLLSESDSTKTVKSCRKKIEEEHKQLEDYEIELVYQVLYDESLRPSDPPCPSDIKDWLSTLGCLRSDVFHYL